MMTILRGLGAVVAGIAVFSVALMAASLSGRAALGPSPEWFNASLATQVLWLGCNAISMIAGGYVAAALAPRAPYGHAVVAGAIQALFTLTAMLTVTDTTTPAWLWVGSVAVTVPAAWAGACIRARHAIRQAGTSVEGV